MSRQIPEKSDVCRFSINFDKFCDNKLENYIRLQKILRESVEIIQFFSISFNRVLQQDSNREEELELEKSRAQRARRISEVLLCDGGVREVAPRKRGVERWMRRTLRGSFSAVSKRNFAGKYALESSRRDLHNALFCTALKSHFFLQNCSTFAKNRDFFHNLLNFVEVC